MKAGLEIHQQLDTNKLFCSCPSTLSEKVSKRIVRKLRAVAGETGEIDIAAFYEQTKGKYFIYEYDDSYSCLVELDEEPPHLINKEALKVSLTIAEFFEMKIPSVIQVMRKTVVDGSNTSGFQRTLLVGLDGKLKLKNKEIKIQTLCLEEDAARKIKEDESSVTYRLDRLGIPLLEIATGPDLEKPEEVKEAAEKIGLILRLTGKVKRGLGTIRQDLNLSIPEGNRVEIKGVQDLNLLPKVAELEVLRQKKLLEWKEIIKSRGIEKFKAEIKDITEVFKNTNCKIIRRLINNGSKVFGIKLEKMSGLIKFEVSPSRRIGSELADVAKRYGLGGIFHSDELPNYGISKEEVDKVKEILNCSESDSFIFVVGKKNKCKFVLQKIIERLNKFLEEVPRDTRQVNPDGTTSFLRPMPGSARMYPETDLPLVYINRSEEDLEDYRKINYEILHGEEKIIFKLIKLKNESLDILEKTKRDCPGAIILDLLDPDFRKELLVKKYEISEKMATDLLWSKDLETFEELCNNHNIKSSLVYYLLFQVESEIENKFGEKVEPDIDIVSKISKLIENDRIVKGAIPRIIYECYKRNTKDVNKVIDDLNLWKLSEEELQTKIKQLIEKYNNIDEKKRTAKILEELREVADPKDILNLLKGKC